MTPKAIGYAFLAVCTAVAGVWTAFSAVGDTKELLGKAKAEANKEA